MFVRALSRSLIHTSRTTMMRHMAAAAPGTPSAAEKAAAKQAKQEKKAAKAVSEAQAFLNAQSTASFSPLTVSNESIRVKFYIDGTHEPAITAPADKMNYIPQGTLLHERISKEFVRPVVHLSFPSLPAGEVHAFVHSHQHQSATIILSNVASLKKEQVLFPFPAITSDKAEPVCSNVSNSFLAHSITAHSSTLENSQFDAIISVLSTINERVSSLVGAGHWSGADKSADKKAAADKKKVASDVSKAVNIYVANERIVSLLNLSNPFDSESKHPAVQVRALVAELSKHGITVKFSSGTHRVHNSVRNLFHEFSALANRVAKYHFLPPEFILTPEEEAELAKEISA